VGAGALLLIRIDHFGGGAAAALEFDGLRGVAITMVLFHTVHRPGGYLGVDIFFVLSGFLITRLLIVEHERTGQSASAVSISGAPSGRQRPAGAVRRVHPTKMTAALKDMILRALNEAGGEGGVVAYLARQVDENPARCSTLLFATGLLGTPRPDQLYS